MEQRIEQDLRGQVSGDVLCDPLTLSLYGGDASIYEQQPIALVRPRNTADVATTLRYAHEHGIPVQARGGGSGLAGGAVGGGLVVDFSRYMHRIISLGDSTARVQAGVVHAKLNRALAAQSRVFGPDPSTTQVTTMGGVLAVNASGRRWPLCGAARDHVESLKIVLADGEVLEVAAHSPGEAGPTQPTRLTQLLRAVADLGERNRVVIQSHQPQTLVNASGYEMRLALEDPLPLAKLLVGSEGTLALITEAEVSTLPLPASVKRALLLFDSLDKAVRCVAEIRQLAPSSCDLMDRRHLTIAREVDVRYDLIIPNAAEAVLLVEFSGDSDKETRQQVDALVRLTQDELGLAAGYYVSEEYEDDQLMEQLPRKFSETLHGLKGRRRATACIEDIAVPPDGMAVFVHHLQDVLKRHQVTASLLSHALHGQLHIRPLLDLRLAEDRRQMEILASEVYEKVWLLGGTISGEHGDG
ncbi:MAG: FAD-binding oxidoreductase, partial [Planctomycetales bacterium]|nr:FAD-binding oxidoreductase [Planctomycetales bacterium]